MPASDIAFSKEYLKTLLEQRCSHTYYPEDQCAPKYFESMIDDPSDTKRIVDLYKGGWDREAVLGASKVLGVDCELMVKIMNRIDNRQADRELQSLNHMINYALSLGMVLDSEEI